MCSTRHKCLIINSTHILCEYSILDHLEFQTLSARLLVVMRTQAQRLLSVWQLHIIGQCQPSIFHMIPFLFCDVAYQIHQFGDSGVARHVRVPFTSTNSDKSKITRAVAEKCASHPETIRRATYIVKMSKTLLTRMHKHKDNEVWIDEVNFGCGHKHGPHNFAWHMGILLNGQFGGSGKQISISKLDPQPNLQTLFLQGRQKSYCIIQLDKTINWIQ